MALSARVAALSCPVAMRRGRAMGRSTLPASFFRSSSSRAHSNCTTVLNDRRRAIDGEHRLVYVRDDASEVMECECRWRGGPPASLILLANASREYRVVELLGAPPFSRARASTSQRPHPELPRRNRPRRPRSAGGEGA